MTKSFFIENTDESYDLDRPNRMRTQTLLSMIHPVGQEDSDKMFSDAISCYSNRSRDAHDYDIHEMLEMPDEAFQ